MAKVEFNKDGSIRAIRGKLGNSVYRTSKNGKLSIVPYCRPQRTTPLSEREQRQRLLFRQAAAFVANLSPEQKSRLVALWRRNLAHPSGKQYATFRGFAMAYFLTQIAPQSESNQSLIGV